MEWRHYHTSYSTSSNTDWGTPIGVVFSVVCTFLLLLILLANLIPFLSNALWLNFSVAQSHMFRNRLFYCVCCSFWNWLSCILSLVLWWSMLFGFGGLISLLRRFTNQGSQAGRPIRSISLALVQPTVLLVAITPISVSQRYMGAPKCE